MALFVDGPGPKKVARINDGGQNSQKSAEPIEKCEEKTAQSLKEGSKSTESGKVKPGTTSRKPNVFKPSQQVKIEIENGYQCVDIKDDGDDSINIANSKIRTETLADKLKDQFEARKEEIKSLTNEELEAREEQVEKEIAQFRAKLTTINEAMERSVKENPGYGGGSTMNVRLILASKNLEQAQTEHKLIREEILKRRVDECEADINALEAQLREARNNEQETTVKLSDAKSQKERAEAKLEMAKAKAEVARVRYELNRAKNGLAVAELELDAFYNGTEPDYDSLVTNSKTLQEEYTNALKELDKAQEEYEELIDE